MDRSDGFKHAKRLLSQKLLDDGVEESVRRKILGGFEKLPAELEARDGSYELRLYSLDGTKHLSGTLNRRLLAVDSWAGGVIVGVLVPDWSNGWHRLFKDERVYSWLSWFLHYSAQYVSRSLVTRALVPLAEQQWVVSSPRSQRTKHRLKDVSFRTASSTLKKWMDHAKSKWPDNPNPVEDTWPERLGPKWRIEREPAVCRYGFWGNSNFIDPSLHQAAFQYMRGVELRKATFDLESVTAFECVLSAAKEFLLKAGLIEGNADRATCARELLLNEDMQDAASLNQFLRNNFSAHSGGWRWWDFYEDHSEFVPLSEQLALATLKALVRLERKHRFVEPDPPKWSDWFWQNFSLLLDSVWLRTPDFIRGSM